MKKQTAKGVSVLPILLFCLLFLLASCAPNPPDFFAYTAQAASAELSGTLNGKPFCARITLLPGENERQAEIEYTALPELQGLLISVHLDISGQPIGSAHVTYGGLSHTQDAASLAGLLAPLAALLTSQEPASVSYSGEEYTLTFESGGSLTLSGEGIPRRVCAKNVDFWIVWWENAEQSAK